jgi:hypothetical protein
VEYHNVAGPLFVTDESLIIKDVPRAVAGGDPYIYPLLGRALKLPNTEEVYRLYQDDHVVINARVSRATPVIQQEIHGLLGPSFTTVCRDAYFFSAVHIARVGSVHDSFTIDLERKTPPTTTTTFSIGTPILCRDMLPFDAGNRPHVSIPIRWGVDMCLCVHYVRNPQVRNGLSLQGTNMQHGSGLLIRNYRPRLFRLNSLDAVETVVLPRNIKRVTSNRGISGHREFSIKVRM